MKFDVMVVMDCWTPDYGVKRAYLNGDISTADNVQQHEIFYDNFVNIARDLEANIAIIDTSDYGLKSITEPRAIQLANKASVVKDYTDVDIDIDTVCEQLDITTPGKVLFLGGCFYSSLNHKPLGINAWYLKGFDIFIHHHGVKKTGPDLKFVPRANFADIDLEIYNDNPNHAWVNVEHRFWQFIRDKEAYENTDS